MRHYADLTSFCKVFMQANGSVQRKHIRSQCIFKTETNALKLRRFIVAGLAHLAKGDGAIVDRTFRFNFFFLKCC